MSQVTGVIWAGEVKMTMVGMAAGRSRTRGGVFAGAGRGRRPGLVLPEEVVAQLAGQLAERARAG